MPPEIQSAAFDLERDVVSSSAMQGATQYFRWQHDLLASHIGGRVLEVGCGVGGFTRTLLGRERVVSVDLEPGMIEALTAGFAAHPEWSGLVADLADPRFPELVAGAFDSFDSSGSFDSPHSFDSVTALNILEHVEDDVGALRSLRAVLPAGGTAAILVPAHQALYGAFDAAVGHHRRYTRAELARKLEAASFEVDRCFYFNAVGAIGWWVNYRLLRVSGVGRNTTLQVGLFDRWVVPVMRRLEARVRPPFGLSAIGLATAR